VSQARCATGNTRRERRNLTFTLIEEVDLVYDAMICDEIVSGRHIGVRHNKLLYLYPYVCVAALVQEHTVAALVH
jgi:hypothetical protein